jgi:DNA-damage-inducible protein D
MQHIVHRDGDQLFTTSEIIAERAEIEHRAVLQLVDRYERDLSEFGQVAFEMRAGYNNSRVRVAKLNEQQSTLLLTYLRNTPVVRQFKKDLVMGFFEMAQEIQELKQQQPKQPAELTKSDLARMVIESEAEKEALAAELTQVTPKAEAYDSFMDADGTYSVGTVAKMLGLSQNKLFQELRNHRVLISKGAMRNTPYQQYMHHFGVKTHTFNRSDGSESTSYTTRVQASGVDFIRRKLGIEKKVAA